MRKTLTYSLAAAATLLAGGTAWAQADSRPDNRPNDRPAMTRAQVEQRAAERFGRMDANDDGVLDQADRAARQAAMFDRMDADGNGSISREEFSARRGEARPARAERGDRGPRGAGRGMGAMGARGMGRAADADRDGRLTAAEFTAAALARFDRMDANKDGTISPDERRTQRHGQRRDRRGERPAG